MSDSIIADSAISGSGYIDAHVHLWTSDVQSYPLAAGFTPEQMQPRTFTAETFFSFTKPVGVTRSVLIQMSFYGFDNSFLLDTIRQHRGVFSGVAVVDAHGRDPAGEMSRLKSLGVRGARISPSKRNDATWLNSAGMNAMWQCGAAERMAICPLINPEDLPAIDRMCGDYPDTPVVIDHCARIGGDGEVREFDLNQLCQLSRYPQVYVKLSAFYFLGAKQPPYLDLVPLIGRLIDVFGPERLMWASDSPFQVQLPHTYSASLELIRDHLPKLSQDEKNWLLSKTAESVFFGEDD